MKWTVFLYGFVMNKNSINLTKKMMSQALENLDYRTRTRTIGNGCDERYENSNETDTDMETLLRIKTNMVKLDLLRNLQNDRIGITEKLALIENHESTFSERSVAYNMSAGGLWKDFNTEIS
jgi:hypothetical protein